LEENENNLFPKSLTDATIQDGGTRKRRDVLGCGKWTQMRSCKIKTDLLEDIQCPNKLMVREPCTQP